MPPPCSSPLSVALLWWGTLLVVLCCEARVHHRSLQEGFHPTKLGEHDELRVLLRGNPSSGYVWEALYDEKVLAKKAEVCTAPSEGGGVGQPCDLEMWFVGKAVRRQSNVTLRYRRPWESKAPLRTVTVTVTSLKPYRGTRRFGAEARDEASVTAIPRADPSLHSRLIQRAQAANIPLVYDPRGLPGFPPIKDQGGCGSCWAFATVGMLEVILAKTFQATVSLSEQYLTSCDRDNYGCAGGWFSHPYHHSLAPDAEPRAGAVLQADFPYTAQDSNSGTPCNSPHPHVVRLSTGETAPPSTDPATLMQLLYQYHALGVYMNSRCTAFGYASQGIVGTMTGSYDHATVLVGYNALSNPPYWILRNSWNKWWGDNGYGYFTMSSTVFSRNYVRFGVCAVQILDPAGYGFGDVYDPVYGPGVSAGMPYYKGRSAGYFLYSGGGKWCLSQSLGSTVCKAYYSDNAVTADLISSAIKVMGSSGMYSVDPSVAILCYVCSVQVSGSSDAAVNTVYDPNGVWRGRPYYKGHSGLLLFYQSEQWCVGTLVGTCDRGYYADTRVAPALSADLIANTLLHEASGRGSQTTVGCYGPYNALVTAPTCASFGSPCPRGQVLTYYSNKACAGTTCTSTDCCIPARTCGTGFACPSGTVPADPSTACSSATCAPQDCCIEDCGVWRSCSSCLADPSCSWCAGTSSCVASSAAAFSAQCTTNASAIPGCSLPGLTYVGCFSDADYHDLPFATTLAPATPQTCAAECQRAGYQYAGVQTPYPQSQPQCYCGNSYGTYGPSSYCNSPCAADPSQICGGIFANSVYLITSAKPTCGGSSFVCPSGFTPKDLSTPCAQTPCTQVDCCESSSSTCTDLQDPSRPLYLSGDYTCYKGTSYICQNSQFVPVGPCASYLIDCSRLSTRCASTWSSELQQSVLYCGRDGDIHSAATLCYLVGAQQYCDNNRGGSGTNWLMQTGTVPQRGFVCPSN